MKRSNGTSEKRESTSVLFLVIVVLTLIRPVSPLISDGIGHTFWNERHHASLHIDGTNHVDEEIERLNEARSVEDSAVPISTFSIDNSLVFHTREITFLCFNTSVNLTVHEFSGFYDPLTISPISEPPELNYDSLLFHA